VSNIKLHPEGRSARCACASTNFEKGSYEKIRKEEERKLPRLCSGREGIVWGQCTEIYSYVPHQKGGRKAKTIPISDSQEGCTKKISQRAEKSKKGTDHERENRSLCRNRPCLEV